MTITSLSNPRVKHVSKLQRQSGERRDTGLFCVEELRLLTRALDAGFEVADLYVSDEHPPADAFDRLVAAGVEQVVVADAVMQKMTYRGNPRQFVAVLRARTATLTSLSVDDSVRPLVVVCSGVEKPGNIGAILRSADAAGATGLIIDTPGFDVFNPNCVRASTGAVFSVPMVCEEPASIRAWCADHDVHIFAATPEAELVYTDADLTEPVALVMGAEDEGVDAWWRDVADGTIRVPMRGVVDSLNVSITTALLLFEAARQRTMV
ncbi:MAG: RNA methyltransferase [Phycisphaera sp.]|nr:RNA methyltransferase [Phycisphaera sp.]